MRQVLNHEINENEQQGELATNGIQILRMFEMLE